MLDKEQQQQKETEIGKCKLNEMRAVNMKWKKWNKLEENKRFKTSLETT